MNQEKFGKFIKELRKKNNLTQAELADKYGVTYQAVSKWETGKNMPDISLIRQMSKDFNIDISNFLDGTMSNKKHNFKNIIIIILGIIIVILSIIIIFTPKNKTDNYKFKTLSSECSNFTISGSISYDSKKSSIYISNIKYCGGNDNTKYKSIECILYEQHDNIDKRIDSYKYNENNLITLENFLHDVTFTIDNYSRACKEFKSNELYLLINASDKDNKITSYKIPLQINDSCSKY